MHAAADHADPAGAATVGEIAQCISNGGIGLSVQADTRGKVADGTQQLTDTAQQFCFANILGEFGAGINCATWSGEASCPP